MDPGHHRRRVHLHRHGGSGEGGLASHVSSNGTCSLCLGLVLGLVRAGLVREVWRATSALTVHALCAWVWYTRLGEGGSGEEGLAGWRNRVSASGTEWSLCTMGRVWVAGLGEGGLW